MMKKIISTCCFLGLILLAGCQQSSESTVSEDAAEETTLTAIEEDKGIKSGGISADELVEMQDQKEKDQENERLAFWNAFDEDIVLMDGYEIYETTATRMVERIKNCETFAMLVLHTENPAIEVEKEIFTKVAYEIVPDFPVYFVEEKYNYDTYAEEMNSIDPLIPYIQVDEDDPFYVSPYHYGIYEFVNGELVAKDNDLATFNPEGMDESILSNMKDNYEAQVRMVIGNLPSQYNFETILHDKHELESYLKENPDCVLYVGRDSCPYCPFVRRGISTLMDRCNWTVPVAYFSAQSYAICNLLYGSDSSATIHAGSEWNEVKSIFTVETIPSIIAFNDGSVSSVCKDQVTEDIYNHLVDNGFIVSFIEGREIDWTLQYSEGSPLNEETED